MDAERARVERPRPLGAAATPLLALVGRPNVGKSTLFNRLTRQRKALVYDEPGVTRDLNYASARWHGREFTVVDTGGFEPDARDPVRRQVQRQTRLAIEEADAIVFLLDGKAGMSPADREAVEMLRRVRKPVFFAVNKIDSPAREADLYEFYRLGVPEIFPVSAEHGRGVEALVEKIVAALPPEPRAAEAGEESVLSLAVVGRPNAGKSTLVNRLLGFERAIVDARPGTTRDVLDTPWEWGGERYLLLDTAGIRRKSRIADRLERYSALRSLRSIDRSDVVIHLLDALEGVTDQDAQVLAYGARRGKATVVAVNKWDLVPAAERDPARYREAVAERLRFIDFAPVVLVSALTGEGLEAMMAKVREVAEQYRRAVSTGVLNRALAAAVQAHPPPAHRGRPVRFFYATQTGRQPPLFTLFVNLPEGVTESYRRYLAHQLRRELGLESVPLQLALRPRREKTSRR
jgi:GTP-binding protein